MNQAVQRISVVDDSDSLRRTFRLLLEHAGYVVSDYASGREFLDCGQSHRADCILLDLEMPRATGPDVLRALNKANCTTPVIVVTGADADVLLASVETDNVAAILKKPIGPDLLLAAVADAV